MWGPLRSVSKESPSAVSGLSGWNPSICDGPSDRAPTAGVKAPLLLPGPEWQAGRCLRVAQGLLCTPGKPGALSAWCLGSAQLWAHGRRSPGKAWWRNCPPWGFKEQAFPGGAAPSQGGHPEPHVPEGACRRCLAPAAQPWNGLQRVREAVLPSV